jgi:hypothetical protein
MRIVAIAIGVLALLLAAMSYIVWRAAEEPVTGTASPVEVGRVQLHAQLEEARKTETQAEKQAWNSGSTLRALVKGHEQRIQKLAGNPQAAEILAYDRDAVTRLNQRIAALAAQEAAKAAAQELHPPVQAPEHPRAQEVHHPPQPSQP